MNAIDKIVGYINPKAGYQRVRNRAQMLNYQQHVRRYEGAQAGPRHSSWNSLRNHSVNQTVIRDLKALVTRSRDITINNPYAKKAPLSIANSVVGSGVLMTPYIRDTVTNGQIQKVKNRDKVIKTVKASFDEWADELTCDYNNDYNFYGLQHLIMRAVIVSGEALVIRKRVSSSENKYGFQLLVLEGDFIDHTRHTLSDPDGGYTYYGIKYDKRFKRTGYYIYDRHPSEGFMESNLIPVKDIIHVYDVERPGQSRGVPLSASTLLKQRDLDDYEDAELLGKKAAACMPIFVENSDPDDSAAQSTLGDKIEELQPGMINYLNPNEKVTFGAPAQNPGFGEFVKTQHRAIANGYLMTYEMFTGDLSNVNFSSGRMGWLEYNRQVQFWQYQMLIPKFCDKVFSWFVESLAVVHSMDTKTIAIRANWTAPRREMIDPMKEVSAMIKQVRAGLISWEELVKQCGYNPEQVLEELKRNQKAFTDAGLVFDWTPLFELQAAEKTMPAPNANNQQQQQSNPSNNNSKPKAKQ